MNLLIDTHALLWFAAGDSRMSSVAKAAIEDSENVNYISMASCWEMAIKCSLGKLTLDTTLQNFVNQRIDEGFRLLSIETQHFFGLTELPFHHRDPFDRLLICQAQVESMALCSRDQHFSAYKIQRIW